TFCNGKWVQQRQSAIPHACADGLTHFVAPCLLSSVCQIEKVAHSGKFGFDVLTGMNAGDSYGAKQGQALE
ncbi:MAG: hypothetical protein CO071_02840, partial [Gallionellales bacterium CG_4_9_14_0_8_um_filter_59_50]